MNGEIAWGVILVGTVAVVAGLWRLTNYFFREIVEVARYRQPSGEEPE